MHGTNNYVPETKPFSTIFNVAAVLYFQVVLHVILFRKLNIFCNFIFTLSAVCVSAQYGWFL